MKKFTLLTFLLLTGCVHTEFDPATGRFSRTSFATQTKFGEVELRTGTNYAHIKGYTSDQVESLKAVAEGLAKGAVQGAK